MSAEAEEWKRSHDLSKMVTDEWPLSHTAQLVDLWFHRDETGRDLSTVAIGRMAQKSPSGHARTKNAVVGRITRMGLPRRPSPIKRHNETGSPPVRIKRAYGGETLQHIGRPEDHPEDQFPPCPPHIPEIRMRGKRPCVWPIGDPKHPSFRFCDCAAHPSRPYCEEHCGIAYIRAPASRQPVVA